MPRPKKKYANPVPAVPAPVPAVVEQPLSQRYSLDLKDAATYTGYSVWALRQAIYSKQLRVTCQKPYIIRRTDLEAFIDSRVQVAA
jgi:hypothetical protein